MKVGKHDARESALQTRVLECRVSLRSASGFLQSIKG